MRRSLLAAVLSTAKTQNGGTGRKMELKRWFEVFHVFFFPVNHVVFFLMLCLSVISKVPLGLDL